MIKQLFLTNPNNTFNN